MNLNSREYRLELATVWTTLAGMPITRICPKCELMLSDASNALRRHASAMTRTISLARNGNPPKEQRQEFTSNLVATFKEAQSAWDAYRGHLSDHGLLLEKSRGIAKHGASNTA